MLDWLWLVPALPLAGFVLLVLGQRLGRAYVAAVGVGSVGLAALVAILIAARFFTAPPDGGAHTQTVWTWISVGSFTPHIAFYLDALSLVMMLVVTVVSFFIHLYSAEFMADDEGYGRFFAYMNLFVCSMLVLVLGDNLLLLYLGWEGVGMCSYLLIGFWYKDSANGRAAIKAFVVTRVGDTAMAIGLFLLFMTFGTLDIQELMQKAPQAWPVGSGMAVAAAVLLLGGAVGKSAQLPLQTWLPDAMAGPTPVSALIHAATMVTAGVYLIARTHVLFSLAPSVQLLVAVVGAVTLLLAGVTAIAQHDIKRVLAYSTISQIGYMFLALGVGAWSAAMFHFMTHALFKALLFLGAGVVIMAMHHEHNMFKMGGLRKVLPLTFWLFLIGCLGLTALPPATGGWCSKDLILHETMVSPIGGTALYLAGLLGAFLTAIYTFRMIFITFFGEAHHEPSHRPSPAMMVPLLVLAAGSLVAGALELPSLLGGVPYFSNFMHSALPELKAAEAAASTEALLFVLPLAVSLAGLGVAWWLWLKSPATVASFVATPVGAGVKQFFFSGWGFDWVYDKLFVRPLVWAARVNKGDFIDLFYRAISLVSDIVHLLLARTENGIVRWYAACVAAGGIIIIAIVVLS